MRELVEGPDEDASENRVFIHDIELVAEEKRYYEYNYVYRTIQ